MLTCVKRANALNVEKVSLCWFGDTICLENKMKILFNIV